MEERDSERPAPGRLSTRSVHEGRIVRLSLDRVRFPDGSEGTLEMIRHPGASAVLPVVGSLDEKDPEILLIHQYRYAAGGYIWEVPAGIPTGPDEPWDVCAGRELEEETGQRAGTLRELTRIYTTPGFTDEAIHLFVATGLTEGERNLDDDEFMEVVRMPMSKALEMVRQGEIVDAKSVATLLFAATFLTGAQEGA
ncbi:MAG: NUDIX hydrolase [Gemmatimonadetes bacterium]|jgi:ADP-ribose pyrophosphatase|nr:NUDIX hydrolase [Gemmatimonadota bacterium]